MRRLVRAVQRAAASIGGFARAREAVAAVEFALVLPVMLTMYIGSIELGQSISVDQRVTTIAGTIGDLVARAKGTISASTLSDYFQAAQTIMSPLPSTTLTQVVTVVYVDANGLTTVKWSQGYNGGTARPVNTTFADPHAIPSAMINISKSGYVVVSEAAYSYLPLLGIFFKTPFAMYHQNFYLPRYPGIICYDVATCT